LLAADFENLKMKALEGANTEARVQVADARNRGDIGVAERQVTAGLQRCPSTVRAASEPAW
jgi:hypothetical protein